MQDNRRRNLCSSCRGFFVTRESVTTYIAYVALVHTAKPKIKIEMNPTKVQKGSEVVFDFEVTNKGHWYAAPPAIDVFLYINFDQGFVVTGVQYGLGQDRVTPKVGDGQEGRKYVKAKGIKLFGKKHPEYVFVHAQTPNEPGEYEIGLDAYSENGVAYSRKKRVQCV